jgi:hypothetical protein
VSLSCVVTQDLPVETALSNLHTIWLANAVNYRMFSLHDWRAHGDRSLHLKCGIFHFAYFTAPLSAVCKVTSCQKFGCQETCTCLTNLEFFMKSCVERLYRNISFHHASGRRRADDVVTTYRRAMSAPWYSVPKRILYIKSADNPLQQRTNENSNSDVHQQNY